MPSVTTKKWGKPASTFYSNVFIGSVYYAAHRPHGLCHYELQLVGRNNDSSHVLHAKLLCPLSKSQQCSFSSIICERKNINFLYILHMYYRPTKKQQHFNISTSISLILAVYIFHISVIYDS